MPSHSWREGRDIVVFVNSITTKANEIIHEQLQPNGKPLKTACVVDTRIKDAPPSSKADILIPCDFRSEDSIVKSLLPYKDRFLAVTCLGEVNLEWFARLIPSVPYLRTPTTKSLEVCVNKILMRKLLKTTDKKITPAFKVVHDASKDTIQQIENKVGFPLVVKPAGLASSLLVSICFHHEELEDALKKTLRRIRSLYAEKGTQKEPQILVEQFMDGEMYSIDGYVTSRGRVTFTPMVKVTTGRSIGFDDFFGYKRITPTTLSKPEVKTAQEVAKKCIHAVGLRSSTAHIELMKTDAGWKVIEIGARMGGYRHLMYELSFGINHLLNDVLNRVPKKLQVPTKVLAHTAVLEFFAKKEGYLTKLKGVRKAKKLASLHEIKAYAKEGDMCRFAKHGGKRIVSVVLVNKKRSDLLADIRRLEKMIEIETSKKAPAKTKNT